MKTSASYSAVLLMLLSVNTFAGEIKNQKLKIDYTVKAYIDAVANGKLKGLDNVLDFEMRYSISHGESTVNYSRSEFLNSLKVAEHIQQNCAIGQQIISSDPSQCIVKITLKYDTFSKVNLITLSNTSKGWKITNISSFYN